MSLPVPSHLLDTVGAAAATTRDAAGDLMHDAVLAVRGRRKRSGRWTTSLPIAAAGLLIGAVTWMVARRRFGPNAARVGMHHNDSTDEESTEGRNRTMTQHTDDLKGRIKEAAGTLSDNDELKEDGKRDQQAAKAKQAVDKTRDAVNDGIDAVKEKLSKS